MNSRKDIDLRKEEILEWIENRLPKNFICMALDCNDTTLNSWLKKNGHNL